MSAKVRVYRDSRLEEKKRMIRNLREISRRHSKICLHTSTPIRESTAITQTRTSLTKKKSPNMCMHFVDVGLPFFRKIIVPHWAEGSAGQ